MTGAVSIRTDNVDAVAGAPAIELAPYALVRLAALPHPPPPRASRPFRQTAAELIRIRRRLAELAVPVADALYESAGHHSTRFHQRVVLPLRRAIHNGRPVRPSLIAAAGDLPDRLPVLSEWLDMRAIEAEVLSRLAVEVPTALAAERATLASLCRSEPVRRGATLIGDDLLYGVARVAAMSAAPSARDRKIEPNVLRYALRATAKTSPLSWFTHVAWGEWSTPDSLVGDTSSTSSGGPLAYVQTNRALLERLLIAVRTDPDLSRLMRYRAAAAMRLDDGRVIFRRSAAVNPGDRTFVGPEEEVVVGYTKPVALLLEMAEKSRSQGVDWADLVAAIATRIPGPRETANAAAADYINRTVVTGLLTPIAPIDPQAPDAVARAADWLAGLGSTELARLLREIHQREREFGTLSVEARVAVLAELQGAWRAAFASAGVTWLDAPVLTEDVVVPGTIRLGRAYGRSAAAGLTGLTLLAELFDPHLVASRLVRERFVARYGVGGQCRSITEYAKELREVWQAATAPDGTDEQWGGSPGSDLADLAELRAAVMSAVVADPSADEVRVPEAVVRQVADAQPGWMRRRPASYSFFVQPADVDGDLVLVVNHVYPGWGRFTSRFLDALGPAARSAVAAQLRGVFGERARVAQFRPVRGFNANLHPRVVASEIGEDPAWVDIDVDQISVYHDSATDHVRLRHDPSGESIDVLYLGFLMPLMLPERLLPLALDLGSGPVDLEHLSSSREVDGCVVRSRVRYQNMVLVRRSWRLSEAMVAAWRADLGRDDPVPVDAATRWIARLGLPTDVFVASSRRHATSAADLWRYKDLPKPQYVDLASALHLRCLSKLFARHRGRVHLSEALPVPGTANRDGRVVEIVAETYRPAAA